MNEQVVNMFRALARERTRIADENRERGIPDPLNDLVDAYKEMVARGETLICKPPRKSKKHRKNKREN